MGAGAALTPPRGAADRTACNHRIDLAPRIAELAEHLDRVLAELRRQAPQARLAALHADRRGDALVPIPGYDVAPIDGVLVGQRLVDLPHGTGRQASGKQTIAERLGLMLREHRGEFRTQRLAIGDAVLVAGKARITAEFFLADFLGELAEGAVIADADEDVVGLGREDRVRHEIRMLVAGEARRL